MKLRISVYSHKPQRMSTPNLNIIDLGPTVIVHRHVHDYFLPWHESGLVHLDPGLHVASADAAAALAGLVILLYGFLGP